MDARQQRKAKIDRLMAALTGAGEPIMLTEDGMAATPVMPEVPTALEMPDDSRAALLRLAEQALDACGGDEAAALAYANAWIWEHCHDEAAPILQGIWKPKIREALQALQREQERSNRPGQEHREGAQP